jgi:6,7-dimethyl-8-ribityllumazine synthase
MSSARHNLSVYHEADMPSASGMHFGIVVAEWNADITHALYEGCYDTLRKHGAHPDHIHTAQVPGSFELTVGARLLLQHRQVDAVICLGCVIKGETSHNEYINHSVAMGLTNLGMTSGKPCIFGVLTPNDEQQALDRAGGIHGNKGIEAAATAIRMVALAKSLSKDKPTIGFELRM